MRVVGTLVMSASAAERRFDIHLARPVVVGDEKMLNLSFTRTVELVITGIPRAMELHVNQAVEFRARATVLDVDDAGNLMRVRLVVEKGTFNVKTGSEQTLGKGDVLIALLKKDKRPAVSREATPLAEEAATLIADALPYYNKLLAQKSDPGSFGSTVPQKVGDTWPVDPQVLPELMPRKVMLDKSILTGSMTLVNAVKFREVPCLKLRTQMRIPHYQPTD